MHGVATDGAVAEPWVSIDDVAAHVGVRKDSIYRWIVGRRLPATKVGKLWKLKLSEVDAWMRAQRDDAANNAKGSGERGRNLRPRLVLVVDDERLVRETVCEFVIDQGHEVQPAADGEEAMALLESGARPPDLVILDLKMPGLDGWHFRERQLQNPKLAAIPVIVVTAVSNASVSGAVVLKKPLSLRALADTMVEILGANSKAAHP
jgi:excisionase family DNA binding protein